MVDDTLPHDGGDEQEAWRPIPSCPGYEASSFGRIRSVDRMVGHDQRRWLARGRIRKIVWLVNERTGLAYGQVTVMGRTLYVQRLVCEAYKGHPPSAEHQAAHRNGDTRDNRPSNLVWATRLENEAHKEDHGTRVRGSTVGSARLTEARIPELFRDYVDDDLTIAGLAQKHGIAPMTAWQVIARKTWKHVDIDPALVVLAQNKAASMKVAVRSGVQK